LSREEYKVNDFVELRRIIAVVFRRWWLVALLTLLAAVIGYAISLQLDPVYEATTSVIVGQSIQAAKIDSRDIQTSERLALSYADIARRQPILAATVESKGLDYSWEALRKRVQVGIVPDTQLLEISVEAYSPEEAVEIADEIANQLVLLSPASLQNDEDESTTLFVQQRLQDLQKKIETNQGNLDELEGRLDRALNTDEKAEIQAEIDKLESLILDWNNAYATFLAFVGSEESSNNIAVIEEAHAKSNPIRPSKRLNTIIAGAVGFMLALGVIFVLEFLDDTLKTVDDIRRDLNLTPLGTIEQFGSRDFRERMIVSQDPFSPVAESYRMIRNNIQLMSVDKPEKSILVTSPAPGAGKSSVVINLGIAMANNGNQTTIVDTDFRKPVLHEVFHAPNSRGLTNLFRGLDNNSPIPLRETEIERLDLLTAGALPPNPSELLGSKRMEQLVGRIMEEADVVIFDSPPAAYVADAAVLSTQVDGVVLVVSAGKTRRDVAKRAIFNLQQAGANILGVVLNHAASEGGRYSYYSFADREGRAENRSLVYMQRIWQTVTFANRMKPDLANPPPEGMPVEKEA